jgi:hypothetical protein
MISHCVENKISQCTVVGVALMEKLFLSHCDRLVILTHWDAILVRENISVVNSSFNCTAITAFSFHAAWRTQHRLNKVRGRLDPLSRPQHTNRKGTVAFKIKITSRVLHIVLSAFSEMPSQ